jgi:hypothetical protein
MQTVLCSSASRGVNHIDECANLCFGKENWCCAWKIINPSNLNIGDVVMHPMAKNRKGFTNGTVREGHKTHEIFWCCNVTCVLHCLQALYNQEKSCLH